MKQIFWLASFPKSGNTWCRKFLDAYCCRARLDLTSHHQKYVRGDFGEASLQAVSNVPVDRFDSYQTTALRAAMLHHMLHAQPLDTLTLKTHHGRFRAAEYELIPPGMTRGAVYLVRDPRAVAVSWSKHMEVSLDDAVNQITHPKLTIGNMQHVLKSWPEHVASWVDDREGHTYPLTVLRYEDLLAEPETMFRCLLYGLGWNDDQVEQQWFDFALRESSLDSLQAAEAATGFPEKKGGERFFREGKADGWRAVLTAEQVRRIEQHCGVMMCRLGYELAEVGVDDLFDVVESTSESTSPVRSRGSYTDTSLVWRD